MIIVNYRNKKICYVYLVYIKIKIVKISKCDLSYMRYYIVIAISELIIFFGPLNDLKLKKLSTTKF